MKTTVGSVRPKPSADVLEPGTSVGEYRIDRVIGCGGMGVVHVATQPLIGKRVAIKVVRKHLCADADTLARFVDEARAVNRICHPNIVDIFSFGTLPDERPYFVMELLDGETLFGRLARQRLPAVESIDILLPVCRALAAAHDKGIVHRDLKPDNIFLAQRGSEPALVKLLDFGIAKLDSEGARRTREGCVVGTPVYLAPEVARGKPADWRSDVYSLGVMAFELFLGRPPFWAKSSVEILGMHISAEPAAPSTLWPEIPPALERLVLQMLSKSPGDRPSVQAVEATLSAVRLALLQSPSDPAPSTVTMPVPAPSLRRRRRAAIPLFGVAALLLVSTAGPWRPASRPRAPHPPPPAAMAPPAAAPVAVTPSSTVRPAVPHSPPEAGPSRPSPTLAKRTQHGGPRHKARHVQVESEDEALDPFSVHR